MSKPERRPELYTPRWRRTRVAVLDRDGWRCRACGAARRLEVHHRRAVRAGGSPFDLANLVTLCRRCHFTETKKETGRAPTGWDRLLQERRDAIR